MLLASKIKKIIVLALVTLFFCQFQLSAQGGYKVTLNKHNVTIHSIFKAIEKESEYTFIYHDNKVDVNRKVSINMKNASIDKLMNTLLRGTNYTYQVMGNQILIAVKEENGNAQTGSKQVLKLVTGTVIDERGEPIIGASILEKGTTNGIITNLDGKFSLNLTTKQPELQVSYIGYLTSFIRPTQSTLQIVLKEDLHALEEVVVVGYAVQKKSDLTGSVGSIKADVLDNQPISRIDQALQGRISGVQVTSTNGAPGSGTSIRIRGGNSINGSNEPLYVIDGIIGGGDLNSINPADIQSIEVLKDASSTAIYGSRGANGVVLITTKKGNGNEGVRLDYHGYFGLQETSKRVDFLNGPEYVEWKNENEAYFGRPQMFDPSQPIPNTDWQKVMYRSAATTEHNVSLSKATKDSNYFLSLNYLNQDGVMRKTNFTRYQLRFNLEQNIGNYIKVGSTLSMSYTNRQNPVMDSFGIVQLPNMSVYNEDGTINAVNPATGIYVNTVAAQEKYIQDFTTKLRGFGNIYAQITPIKGMVIKSSFGFDMSRDKQNVYQSVDLPTRVYNKSGGYAAINTSFPLSYQNENTISYAAEIGRHRFDLLGGWTAQHYESEFSNSSASGFTNDVNLYHAIEAGDPKTKNMQSGESQWSLLSALFRVNYVYHDRYMLTVSGRSDGSSRLSKDKRWAFFPSAALAWRLSEEKFIKDLNLFSSLKLRASYGRSGSQAVSPYSTLDQLTSGQTVIGDAQFIYFKKNSISNKNLTWEKTDQFDLGLNFGLFNNRVNVELDWYYKKTSDLLLYRELPYQTGFSSVLENVGSVDNKGFELTLNTINITNKDFEWSSVLTLSTNKSNVVDLGGKEFLENGMASRLIVGKPVGTFYGIKYLGTWKENEIPEGSKWKPGDPKLEDVNKDGAFTVADATTIGNAEPALYGGFGNTFTYKNWSMNLFFDFSVGNDIYDLFAANGYGGYNTNLYGDNRDRWTPDNSESNIPRAGSGYKYIMDSYAGKGGCSFFVYDGSFLRLKNLNLEYAFPNMGKKVIKNLSVYGSVSNLFTLTKYHGYSPDVNSEGAHATRRGFDNNAYPQSRIYTVGLKIGF